MDEPVSGEPGAYLLSIELAAPLALGIPRFGAATLAPGRYVYCGSAYGPGACAPASDAICAATRLCTGTSTA